jgi:hypothetical protein
MKSAIPKTRYFCICAYSVQIADYGQEDQRVQASFRKDRTNTYLRISKRSQNVLPGSKTDGQLPLMRENSKPRPEAKTDSVTGKPQHFDRMSGFKRTKSIAFHKTPMYDCRMSIASSTMALALPTMAMLSYKMSMSRDRMRTCVLRMDIADRGK